MIMDGFFVEVKPIIIYPPCLKAGRKQDCFACNLYKAKKCPSPRGMCVWEYTNHKKGCPNYGKKKDCPPYAPMLDQVFDMSRPIYAVYSVYDFHAHVEKMRHKHPGWTDNQLRCVLYWQRTARKVLKERMADFLRLYREKGYYVTTSPEAMGVDVMNTLKDAGIVLEWPVKENAYQVAFAGVPVDDTYLEILI